MNPAPPTIPSLPSLFWRDLPFKRAANTTGFMLMVAVGFLLVTPPNPPPPGVDLSFEIAMSKWVPVGAFTVAAVAALILLRRYLWVKKVLTEGTTIKGKVEDMEVYEREANHSDTTPAFQRPTIRSYYAVIRYTWKGEDKKVSLKLPNSPSVYGTFKGHEVDLIILDSAPNKPLIRNIYLGRF